MKRAVGILILLSALTFPVTDVAFAAFFGGEAGGTLGWKFEYDDGDRVTKATDPAGRETRVQYSFDDAKRLSKSVQTRADGSSVTLELDQQGRRTAMTDGAGSVSYGYDDLGRLNRIQRRGAPAIAYTYDTLDRITSLRVGDSYRVDYVYDFLGRLESMKTPAGVIQYKYLTGQGQVIRTLPNGVKTIREYEANGHLRRITHGLARNPNDNRYEVLAEYTYQYRPDGLIDAIGERSGSGQFSKAYKYDTVGRLISATGQSGQQYSYEYDLLGNRTKAEVTGKPPQISTYDWAGRITTLDGNPCQHDKAGNLTSMTIGGATTTYRYNLDNQLAGVQNGKAEVIYRYDGEGRMIARNTRGTETTLIPDPLSDYWQPLVMEEKGGRRTLIIWEGATPLLMIRDGKSEYFLHDHLGTVRMVVDAQGRVTERLDYEPFGSMVDSGMAAEFAPRFAGLFWDPLAGVCLTRARAYSPQVARFQQTDPEHRVPVGFQKDMPIYAYCGGDPVNFVDRNGAEAKRNDILYSFVDQAIRAAYNDLLPYSFLYRSVHAAELMINRSIDTARKDFRYYFHTPVRDQLINEIVSNALEQNNNDIIKASEQVEIWRSPNKHPNSPKYSDIYKSSPAPSDQEWQIVSNYMTSRSANKGAQLGMLIGIPLWSIIHYYGEKNPDIIKPSFFTGIEDEQTWQRQVFKTHFYSYKGIWDSLFQQKSDSKQSGIGSRNIQSASAQWHGAVVVNSARRATPSEYAEWKIQQAIVGAASAFGGGPGLPEGVLASTTGPGKRGGRGGGITRPPSWNPPGSQGRPPGPQPPPGGKPPPGGSPSGGGNRLSMVPTSVGGVYLTGTGESVGGIGLLDGVVLGSNNSLVLIGKAGKEIRLPALRLDDVVTVFRSVYLHGEGPTVTIDPNPENPEGSAMIIRHGKATENTYVGWVLYEADRLMKGYTLGVDNKSTQQLISNVPGYLEVLNTIYFGGESPEKRRKEGYWERFWIVPAEARRFEAKRKELTLFDVPLKVKTQKMKWEKGKLVDDLQGKSSPGALAFTDWFTTRYDLIAGERFLTPPHESGITHPVPVFTELRRIALITAIAEKLCDQGVPLPFWMRDYEVQPVPFEKFTPGLEVTRSNQRLIARIYGGVELSPSDKDVRTFTPAADLSKLPKTEQISVRQKINLADSLEETVRTQVSAVEPLRVRQFTHQGEEYGAVAVPGAETQSLAPCRLEEVDLAAPVAGGDDLRLVRSYHSFFNPTGPLGRGWTMDLPRIEEFKVPVKRDGKAVQLQTGAELITPLNSLYARFFRIEEVPALNRARLQVPDQPCEFLGLADGKPDFLSGPTRQLIRKDGGIWHFSKSGSLVATEQGGYRTVYERDDKERLTRIVGLQGRRPVASIELRYDAAGRLQSGRTSSSGHEFTVRYEYDNDGRLTGVVSELGRTGYRYDGSRLTEITFRATEKDGKQSPEVTVRRFEYNARGQLLAEVDANGARTEYRVTADAKGTTITMGQPGGNANADSMRYDQAFRPVEAKYANGTRASWNYPADGGTVLDVTGADGNTVRFQESADKRRRTLELDKQNRISGEYDPAGRLTALAENGQTLLSQEWAPDGRLRTAKTETSAAHLEYGADGLTSRVILTPPGEQGQYKQWQETRLDAAGRPVEISDYRGMRTSLSYDDSGDLTGMTSQQDGKSYGLKVSRDKSRRIQDIQSSWGNQHYSYDAEGLPAKVEIDKAGQKASAEWKSGQLQKVTQFDGGTFSVIYNESGKQAGLPRQITTPNRLTLTYDYDESSPREIEVGKIYKLNYEFDNQRRLKSLSLSPAK